MRQSNNDGLKVVVLRKFYHLYIIHQI